MGLRRVKKEHLLRINPALSCFYVRGSGDEDLRVYIHTCRWSGKSMDKEAGLSVNCPINIVESRNELSKRL